MNLRRILLILTILLLLPFAFKLKANDFGQGQSLFSDVTSGSQGRGSLDFIPLFAAEAESKNSHSGPISLLNDEPTENVQELSK